MPNLISKKRLLSLVAAGFLSVVFFLTIFVLPSFSASYCNQGVDPDRCNSNFPNIIQTCGNCDADPDSEWCNSVNCATSGKICSGGTCQTVSNCTDADGDQYGTSGSTGCLKSGVDCNDNNTAINPGATEICGNGVDEDCAGGDKVCTATLSVSLLNPTSFEYLDGDDIYFSASAIGGSYPYNYDWQSSIDGNLYFGYNNYLNSSKLSIGTHSIDLNVRDSLGASASKTFNLTVKASSSMFVSINYPYTGNVFPAGGTVNFSSYVSVAKSPLSYVWSSDLDGVISTASNFSISSLSTGDHKINLTVTDATPKTITTSINIKIDPGIVLTISQPTPGAYEQGQRISFYSQASGGTGPYQFSWVSDKDGFMGNFITSGIGSNGFGSFRTSALSLGTHQITADVVDSTGAKVSKSVTLEIVKAQCFDEDNDKYGAISSSACTYSGIDCNDADASINPGTTEVCPNTIDENCNGSTSDCPVTLTVLSPSSDGQTFAWGTNLNLRIKGTSIVSFFLYIYDSSDKLIKSFTLYDDGKHNDGAAGDNIWGTDAMLFYADGNYYINASVNGITYTKIRNFNINDAPTCTTIVNNGNSADKLDIVFIADQYTSAEMPNFVSKVKDAYTYLFGIKPYDTQNSKINIHRIDSPINLGCAGWGTSQPNCNFVNIPGIANLCPNDKTIVMVDGNFRAYAYFGGYAIIAANDSRYKGVVAHEFGHSFGLLHDEYVDSGVSDPGISSVNSSINCDTSSVCSKWNSVTGTSCHMGCDYRNTYYRSINNGIMKDSSVIDYGVININELNKKLNSYK